MGDMPGGESDLRGNDGGFFPFSPHLQRLQPCLGPFFVGFSCFADGFYSRLILEPVKII